MNTSFGTFTTEINRVGGIVDAATSSALANQVAKRDAKGGANFGANGSVTTAALSALAPDASTYTFYGRMFTGGLGVRIQNQAGAADIYTLDPLGNQVNAGTITATGLIGPLTGNVTGTVSGNAGGLAAPIAFAAAIADYKLAPSVSAGQVGVSAGGHYGDSLGNGIGPLGAQVAILPAQPSGTNIQYCAVSLAPATGAPVVTAGAVGAAPAKPGYPVGNAYLGMVTWRGATTLPTGIVAPADITPAIIGGGGGGAGGGSGTTDATVRAAAIALQGINAALPNGFDLTNVGSNGFVNMALVKFALTDAAITNIIKSAVTSTVVDHVGASGGALVVTINPNSPVSVALTGYGSRTNTGTTTTTNSLTPGVSAAGVYYLVADLTTAGVSAFTTQVAASVGAGQVALAAAWWDGTQWQLGGAGNFNAFIAYPFLPNPLVRPIVIPQQGWTPGAVLPGSAGAYTNLPIPNANPYTVYLPLGGMRMDLALDAWVTYGTSVADFYLGAFATAAAAIGATLVSSIHASAVGVATASTPVRHFFRAQLTNVGPGPVTAQPGYANGSANTAAFQVTGGQSFFWGEVNRQ